MSAPRREIFVGIERQYLEPSRTDHLRQQRRGDDFRPDPFAHAAVGVIEKHERIVGPDPVKRPRTARSERIAEVVGSS